MVKGNTTQKLSGIPVSRNVIITPRLTVRKPIKPFSRKNTKTIIIKQKKPKLPKYK